MDIFRTRLFLARKFKSTADNLICKSESPEMIKIPLCRFKRANLADCLQQLWSSAIESRAARITLIPRAFLLLRLILKISVPLNRFLRARENCRRPLFNCEKFKLKRAHPKGANSISCKHKHPVGGCSSCKSIVIIKETRQALQISNLDLVDYHWKKPASFFCEIRFNFISNFFD